MYKTQKPEPDTARTPSRSTVILMWTTFLGTTWRIFIPTLGGLAVGFWLDLQQHTGPWYSVAGVFVGSWISVWLIVKQLKAVQR